MSVFDSSELINSINKLDSKLTTTNDKLDTLNTTMTNVDSSVDDLGAKLDITNERIGDPTSPGTKSSLLEALGDESTDHTVIKELEDVDSTLQVTNDRLDILHNDLQTLDSDINTLGDKIDTTNTKLDTLHTDLTALDADINTLTGEVQTTNDKLDTLNSTMTDVDSDVQTLDTSINNLKDSVDFLSSRYVTVYESALAIQGQSEELNGDVIYTFAKKLTHDDEYFAGLGLTYDPNNDVFYAAVQWNGGSDNALIKFTESDSNVTYINNNLPYEYVPMAFDSDNNKLYAVRNATLVLAELSTVDGTEQSTVTITGTYYTPYMVLGMCYVEELSEMFITYADTSSPRRVILGVLNTSTGAVTREIALADTAGTYLRGDDSRGLFYSRGVLWAYYNYASVNKLYGWYPHSGNYSAIFGIDAPKIWSSSSVCSNQSNFKIYTTSGRALVLCTITATVRTYSQGGDITISDGGGSITVDGSVTSSISNATNMSNGNVSVSDTATQIVSSRTNRRGLLIQNDDSSESVWIGSSSVSVSNGIEILPKGQVTINNYGGSMYGICSSGKTADVRYMEVW